MNLTILIFKKFNAFHQLQNMFAKFTIFIHFDSKRQLYIDLNAFKKFDFGVHVYHKKFNNKNFDVVTSFNQKIIESIFYLNHLFIDVETRY